MVNICHLAKNEVEPDKKNSFTILGKREWYLPIQKVDKQNSVVSGVCIVVWGL